MRSERAIQAYEDRTVPKLKIIGVPNVEGTALLTAGRAHLLAYDGVKTFPSTVVFGVKPNPLGPNVTDNLNNGGCPPFHILSAATGLEYVHYEYSPHSGHTITVLNDMAAPMYIVTTTDFHADITYTVKNILERPADSADEWPTFEVFKMSGNIRAHSMVTRDNNQIEDRELVERIRHKAQTRITCKVTIPDSLDIAKKGPFLNTGYKLNDIKTKIQKFSDDIRFHNLDFKLIMTRTGVQRPNRFDPDDVTFFDNAMDLMDMNTTYTGAAAVMLDYYPGLNEQLWKNFVLCRAKTGLPKPTPMNILAQYSDHYRGQTCKPEGKAHHLAPGSITNFVAFACRGYTPASYHANQWSEKPQANPVKEADKDLRDIPDFIPNEQEVEATIKNNEGYTNRLRNKYGCTCCYNFGNNRMKHGCIRCRKDQVEVETEKRRRLHDRPARWASDDEDDDDQPPRLHKVTENLKVSTTPKLKTHYITVQAMTREDTDPQRKDLSEFKKELQRNLDLRYEQAKERLRNGTGSAEDAQTVRLIVM